MTTKNLSNHERVQVWSTLVDYPVFYYDEQHDLHLCAWLGVIIPRSAAIMILAALRMQLYVNNTQKQCVVDDFIRMTACGISTHKIDSNLLSIYNIGHEIRDLFRDSNDNTLFGTPNILGGSLSMPFRNLMEKYSTKTVIEWLSPNNEKFLGKLHETNV